MRYMTIANTDINDIVSEENGQVVTSSRQVAEAFGKEHKNVLANIREILVAENSATKMFYETSFEYRGQSFPEYIMNRDGFSLLAMGFTGKEALQWKLKYINAFNEMEKRLKEPSVNVEPPDTLAKMREETRLNYSLAKKANELYKLIKTTGVESHKNILVVYSANMLAQKEILELPSVERSFTATEVGKKLGISAKKVGMIANELHLKADMGCENEYGRWVSDVCKNDVNKQVEAWRYTSEGIEAIREHITQN